MKILIVFVTGDYWVCPIRSVLCASVLSLSMSQNVHCFTTTIIRTRGPPLDLVHMYSTTLLFCFFFLFFLDFESKVSSIKVYKDKSEEVVQIRIK